MKTSNKIILLTALTLLTSLTFYNLALKAEYKKGEFKDEFYSYAKLDFNNFNEIEVNAGNVLDLKIVRSDKFDIRVRNRETHPFTVLKEGRKLIINVTDSLSKAHYDTYEKEIVIFCPKIDSLKIRGHKVTYYDNNDKLVTKYSSQNKRTLLEGFSLTSLFVSLGNNCTLTLQNNQIQSFKSKIGDKTVKGANLIIERTNKIDSAHFIIENENKLSLINPQINNINYKIADNSIISLNGSVLALLKNP